MASIVSVPARWGRSGTELEKWKVLHFHDYELVGHLLDINIEIPPEFHVGFSSDNYIIRT